MNKVLIIGDLHIGVKNNSSVFMDYMKEYFNNELFPLIKKNNIKTVIQLGDTLDKRKVIDFTTSAFLIKEWFSWFDNNDVKLYSILGNHDIYYKNTNSLSGVKQYESIFKNIHIITEPTSLVIENTEFKLIPWIIDENKEKSLELLKKHSKHIQIVCGHFELAGFQMMKGVLSKTGTMEIEDFSGVYKVYSGHYHTPSINDNIEYIGTPYNINWNDYGDKKNIVILDCDNPTIEQREYTKTNLFKKIFYNDNIKIDDIILPQNGYIKVIVDNKSESLEYFINTITEKYNLSDCQIIDNTTSKEEKEYEMEHIELDEPFSILLNSIKNIDNEYIENELISIYKEAKLKYDNV